MAVPFSFNTAENGTQTLVFIGSRGYRLLPDEHVNFGPVKALLLGDETYEEADLYRLADASATVAETLRRLSRRVTIQGDTIYFDGDPMENKLTRHIVDMIRSGDTNWPGYVAFLENVKANPSKSGRKGLFAWLERENLVITDDGHFIGYKSVDSNGQSHNSGREDVTVTLEDGTVETHKGKIPYPVGAVVEMARSLVDPDRDTACSVGLHVGTHNYATSFFGSSGKVLTVKVNPADVVAVPADHGDQKIRTHRLTVLEINEGRTQYTGTSLHVADPDELELEEDPETYGDDGCDGYCEPEDYCEYCGY